MQKDSNIAISDDAVTISPGSRFRAAMILAIIADAFQLLVFPLFVEGAFSPADDVLDFGVAALLIHLLGWHWEFLPSFAAKLLPGVDLFLSGRSPWRTSIGNRSRLQSPQEKNRQELPALRIRIASKSR